MKRTLMSKEQLREYIERWSKKKSKYMQGSRNWLKVHARICTAEVLLAKKEKRL